MTTTPFILLALLLRASLQDEVNVIYYKLDTDFRNFTELREFEANATIKFKFESGTLPEYVRLYASNETLAVRSVTLNEYDLAERHFGFEDGGDVLRVLVPRELGASNSFKIVVRYAGLIGDGSDECGLFAVGYGEGRWFVGSNFGGECAKRVLPVFQEYGVKSTYEISMVVPIEYFAVFSTDARIVSTNEEKRIRSYTFQTTPKIAPSSLQIVLGEFDCKAWNYYDPVKICTCIKLNDTEAFAADTLIQLMHQLENITNVEYKNCSSKVDLVVLPVDVVEPASALGIIAAGPEKLLWKADVSSDRDRQRIATFLARKVAEQCFVHFVSPKSHERNILNEGLADHFAYKALNEMYQEQHFEERFMVDVYQTSLEAESRQRVPLDLGHQLFGINEAKFSRGSCLMKMTGNILGDEVFNNATTQFLSKHRLSTVEPEDFWNMIDENVITDSEELPANFSKIMENWTKSTRYPILEVKEKDGDLRVTQKPFGGSGTSAESWYIPISLTTENREYPEIMWSTPETPTVELEGSVQRGVILNKNSGYYRVDYDGETWAKLLIILQEPNFGGLTETERSLLADDVFGMAKEGKMRYVEVGDLLGYLQEDTFYFSWYTALKGFRYLLDRTGEDTELGRMISKKMQSFLEKSYNSLTNTTLPMEHNHIDSLNKEQILYWSCRLGNVDCIQNLQGMFDRYKTNYITINANVKKMVFCSVLRYNNDFTDMEFIWKEFNNSSEVLFSKSTFLPIVGCLKDERMLEMSLNYVLTETDQFTSYDFMVVFTSVYEENPEGKRAALKFFSQNAMSIYERLGNLKLQKIVTGLANKLTTADEFQTLKSLSLNIEGFEKILTESSSVVESNIAWLKTYRSDLESHFIYGHGSVIESPLWASIVFLCFVLISFCVYNTTSILYLFSPVTYQEQGIMLS